MRWELPLVVLEGDDEALPRVGGVAHSDVINVVGGLVADLGGGEVEVAELLGPDGEKKMY